MEITVAMEAIYTILASVFGTAGIIFALWLAYKRGRVSVIKEQAEKSAALQKKYAEIAVNKPSGKRAVSERLRGGKV